MIRAAQLIPSLIIGNQDKKIGSLAFTMFCDGATTIQTDEDSAYEQHAEVLGQLGGRQ
jgi:hypothetical protein